MLNPLLYVPVSTTRGRKASLVIDLIHFVPSDITKGLLSQPCSQHNILCNQRWDGDPQGGISKEQLEEGNGINTRENRVFVRYRLWQVKVLKTFIHIYKYRYIFAGKLISSMLRSACVSSSMTPGTLNNSMSCHHVARINAASQPGRFIYLYMYLFVYSYFLFIFCDECSIFILPRLPSVAISGG